MFGSFSLLLAKKKTTCTSTRTRSRGRSLNLSGREEGGMNALIGAIFDYYHKLLEGAEVKPVGGTLLHV